MKLFKLLYAFLVLLTLTAATAGNASAKLSEPDVVYLGLLAGGSEGNVITLKLDADGATLKTATVLSGLSFVLRVPMGALDPRITGTARVGDKATFYLGDKVLQKIVIPERGSIVKLPLSVAQRTLDDWKKLHPDNDGSGDANRNGISDLQDFLNGNDPSLIWSALTLSTLADKTVTANPILNVAGTVNDNGSGNGVKSVAVNDKATLVTNGRFTIALPLVDGPNIITAVATDSADNKTIETRTITLDHSVPTPTVSNPADNSITGKEFIDVTGSVDDPSTTVTARVNDGTATSATMTGANFSVTLNLKSGLNTIDLTARSLSGAVGSAKRTLISDAAAPTLAITAPAQDISTDESSVTINGTVTDVATSVTVGITVDDQSYTPSVVQDGRFSQVISLATDKNYTVVVTATDQAGNSATVQRNIIKSSLTTLGDINGDGVVDIADALKVLRIAAGVDNATAAERAKADVAPLKDGKPAPDGIVDISDAVVILQKAVKLKIW